MQRTLLLASLLMLGAALPLHPEQPSAWPMPSPLPSAPAGANAAVLALPRVDWLARVQADNDAAAKVAGSIRLVFDGDSITDFWHQSGEALWQERYGKLGAFDFGINGDRTESVLWRLSQGQMHGIHPKLILLMIGTNNLGTNKDEDIALGIQAILEQYRKLCPGAVILLQGIFPRGHEATDPSRSRIKAINKIISTYADGKQVLFLDFGDKFLQPDGTLSPEIMPDYLHPNAKGYEIWAEAIQPVIDQYFPPAK